MRSSRARTLLTAYLEGDLDPETQERLEDALERDPELQQELHELRATVALLRGLPEPEAPPALAAQVMQRVRAGEAKPAGLLDTLRRLFEPALMAPAAAVAVALAVFVGVTGVGQRDDVPPSRIVAESSPVATLRTPPEVARELQTLAHERLARRGPRHDVTRILRGAGHPHSDSLAGHLEGEGDIAFASFSQP